MLIDAHCHLNDEQFNSDVDTVISRAHDAGVKTIINAGADVESSRAAVSFADRYKSIYAVVGIHPEHAASFDENTLKAIRELAQHRKVIGIGEIGLDFYWENNPPRDVQEHALVAQLDLAKELGKPVVVHDRNAHVEIMNIIAQHNGTRRGMLHCFSGDLAMAQQAIDLGWYISFAGSVTFKNAQALQEIARTLPLDRIIIETDSPYLSPLRGKRNEPANVVLVAKKIAELKEIPISSVEQTTTENIARLFGLGI